MKALAALFCLAACAVVSTAATPTFHKDIQAIFQNRCQECHRAGEAAPMPLLTYKDARPWAKAVKQAVLAKRMPPWFADPHYGKFSNDRSLSEKEKNTIAAWVDAGAPEGNPKTAPAPRQFTDGWNIGKPDGWFDVAIDAKMEPSALLRQPKSE